LTTPDEARAIYHGVTLDQVRAAIRALRRYSRYARLERMQRIWRDPVPPGGLRDAWVLAGTLHAAALTLHEYRRRPQLLVDKEAVVARFLGHCRVVVPVIGWFARTR
jgi:hypothetical protein